MTSEHRLRRRVHFYEVDLAGFVHFSWFFRYMEEAEHALWREAGLTIATHGEQTGFPRLAASCEFHAPLHFEDEFEILIRVAAITRRTMSYSFVMTRGETRIASGNATIACVDRRLAEPLKAIDIPHEIADRFAVAPDAEENA